VGAAVQMRRQRLLQEAYTASALLFFCAEAALEPA
jgi:hypothetical protein